MYDLQTLIFYAKEKNTSDVHLTVGLPPMLRIDGELRTHGDVPLTEQEILDLGVERREISVGFELGDTVKVIDGPLEGFLGTVDEIDPEGNSVRLIVSMFGRETPIDLELDQVEPVKEE